MIRVGILSYDPPHQSDDSRICQRCLRSTGSYSGADLWPILNTLTGKYHSSRGYGETDCGVDATADHFAWPL